jgi:TPR repeat protein
MGMTRKSLRNAAALLVLLALPAAAGPLEDGLAAYNKGDYSTAATAFTVAASQGNAEARTYLGIMFLDGNMGVKQDIPQGMFWLTQAAKQGHMLAQATLGTMYKTGKFVNQSWPDAISWLEKAAAQNFPGAESELGEMYVKGYGATKPDFAKGVPLLNAAAQAGDAKGEFTLGFLYYSGRGVTQNYVTAVNLFQAAANQNYVDALAWMGVVYQSGQGVPVDLTRSAYYMTMAGARGNLDALGILGEYYVHGRGVKQDYVRGYLLTNIAANQFPEGKSRDSAVKGRDEAAKHLTAQEVGAAQQLGSFCHDAGYILCVDSSLSVMSEAADPKGQLDRLIAASQKARQQEAGQSGAAAPAETASSGKPQMVGNGTGFFVSPDGDLVTAAHVTAECPVLRVGNKQLTLVAQDTASDVAVLTTGAKSPGFFKLRGQRGPRVGEPVVVIGYPLQGVLGEDPIVTTGIISSLAGLQNDRRQIQFSAPIQPGNSGGPVMGEDGAIVGVAVSTIGTLDMAKLAGAMPENVNFASSVGTLQSFLNAHHVNYVLTDGKEARRSSADLADSATRYTVMIECWR